MNCWFFFAALLTFARVSQAAPIVAIIDTGVDSTIPELKQALWANPRELPNERDDDGNGLTDDINGWDFVEKRGELRDNHGHGTHIAGIIHAGAPSARLMILRFYDAKISAEKTIQNTVEAIHYAVKMGANIINYSGGGASSSPAELIALESAQDQGVLVIAAAGNEGRNTDSRGYFPADYPVTNILSVTAQDRSYRILATSNFGRRSVDIAALGADVVSFLPGGKKGLMTGTSQATAQVTAVAANLWEKFPFLRAPEQMIRHLKLTGRSQLDLLGRTSSGQRLDPVRSLVVIPSGASADFQFFFDANELVLSDFSDREPSSDGSNLALGRRITAKFGASEWQSPYKGRLTPKN